MKMMEYLCCAVTFHQANFELQVTNLTDFSNTLWKILMIWAQMIKIFYLQFFPYNYARFKTANSNDLK